MSLSIAPAAGTDALRTRAAADPRAAIKEAAKQFEALFMQEVMKSMRQATLASGLLDNAGSQMGTEMLDTQFAQQLSGLPGGLADLIARQLERQVVVPGAALPSLRCEICAVWRTQQIRSSCSMNQVRHCFHQRLAMHCQNGAPSRLSQSSSFADEPQPSRVPANARWPILYVYKSTKLCYAHPFDDQQPSPRKAVSNLRNKRLPLCSAL